MLCFKAVIYPKHPFLLHLPHQRYKKNTSNVNVSKNDKIQRTDH